MSDTVKKFFKTFAITFSVIVLLFLITMFCVSGYSRVYPNTFVEDFNLGGTPVTQVAKVIQTRYNDEDLIGKSVSVTCNGITENISGDAIGVKFDNAALADTIINNGKTGNSFTNTFSFLKSLFTKTNITPVVVYDRDAVAKVFDNITKDYETEPVPTSFKVEDGTLTIYGPQNGVKADRNLAFADFERNFYSKTFGTVKLSPKDVAPAEIDIDEAIDFLTADMQESYYEKVDGKIVVREGRYKCDISKGELETAIKNLSTSADNKVVMNVPTTAPTNTTEELTQNLYKDVLGQYSTNYASSSAARANNVRLASKRVNGTELMPGEEFSYDKTILPRTPQNGYMSAPVYVGNKVESGLGGGICQPSSTLYAAALYANLEIVERHNHSLPVSYLPAGLDATIAEGYLDLRIRNNTEFPVKISATTDGGIVKFTIYGFNKDNISVDVQRSFDGGIYYVTRVVKQDGTEIKREAMTTSRYGVKEEDEKPEEEKPEEETPEETPTETPEGESPEQTPDGQTPSENPDEQAPAEVPEEQTPDVQIPEPLPETPEPPVSEVSESGVIPPTEI